MQERLSALSAAGFEFEAGLCPASNTLILYMRRPASRMHVAVCSFPASAACCRQALLHCQRLQRLRGCAATSHSGTYVRTGAMQHGAARGGRWCGPTHVPRASCLHEPNWLMQGPAHYTYTPTWGSGRRRALPGWSAP